MVSCNSRLDRHDYMYVTDVVNLWKQGCSSLYYGACLLRVKWLDRVSVDVELQLLFWQTRQLVYDWSCLSVETGLQLITRTVDVCLDWGANQYFVIGSGVCRWWVATPVLTDTTTCIWLKLFVCGNRVAAHANCWCLLRVRCKPILCDRIGCL